MGEIVQLCKDVVVQGPTPVTRQQVMDLEQSIAALPDHVDFEQHTFHHFAPGVYLRELFIPAGTVLTGKIHRTKHITIVCSGTLQITTDRGVEQITGPAVFVSDVGAKKAIYAITDATIMNPLPTHETDIEKIEEIFTAPTFDALEYTA